MEWLSGGYERSSLQEGLSIRREVMGDKRVRDSLEKAHDLAKPLQDLMTSFAWGEVWTRSDLSRRDRSILTLGLLIALGKMDELRAHFVGGIRNGLTKDECREIVIHAAVYCGFPASLSAMKVLCDLMEENNV